MTLNKDFRPSTIAVNHPVESELKADADPAAKSCVPVFLPGKSVPDISTDYILVVVSLRERAGVRVIRSKNSPHPNLLPKGEGT